MLHLYTATLLAIAAALVFWRSPHRQQLAEALLFGAMGIYVGGGLANWGIVAIPADLLGISGVSLTLAGLYANRFEPQTKLWVAAASTLAIFLILASVLEKTAVAQAEQIRTLLKLHILFILAAGGFLCCLGFIAIIYLLKERGLRLDPSGLARRLPSLDQLDKFQLRSLQAGFVLLSVGMAFGFKMYFSTAHRALSSDLLAATTTGIWLLMAFALYLRLWRGWRGHRLAVFSSVLTGLLVVVVSYSFVLRTGTHGG